MTSLKPRRKNILNIDSSNLNNFDLNSSSISDVASTIEPKNKSYEYDIDLNDLRSKLAESSLGKKPNKTKKSKSKKKEKEIDENETAPSGNDEANAGISNTTATPQEHISTTEDNIISVKKPKKTKKKNKAIILED